MKIIPFLKNKAKNKNRKREIAQKKEKLKAYKQEFVNRNANFFSKLFFIIKKDLKLLINSKVSALIFFLGPLLVLLLVSLAFNTSSLHNLKIASYSENYSNFSKMLLLNLTDQQYNVIKKDSHASCISAVKFENFHICIVFPRDFFADQTDGNSETKIKLYVDESRINLAHLISNQISSKVSTQAAQISTDLVQNMVNILDSTNKEVSKKQSLLQELKTSNKDASSKVNSAKESLESLDLRYTEINATSQFSDEILSISSDLNISTSTFSELQEVFDDLQDEYNDVILKLEKAGTKRGDIGKDLKTAGSSLSGDYEKISSIDVSLEKIKSDFSTIKITDAAKIVTPFTTSIEPLASKKSYLAFMFPTLIVLLVLFFSILMGATLVVREKNSKAHFRTFITPTHNLLFILGAYATNILVILIQLVLMFIAALLILKNFVSFSILFYSLFALLVVSTLFIMLGMALGYLFNNEETAILAAICLSSIFLFFSNTLLPIESLSNDFMAWIVRFNPFVISETIIKFLTLFEAGFSEIDFLLYMLLAYIAIFFVILFVVGDINRKLLHK